MTFEQLANQLIDTQRRKNSDYGNSFDQTLNEFGLVASATRMSDKFNRFKSLMKCGSTAQVEDEKIEDTLMDLAAYAIMTVEWIKKNHV
jgi:isopropylmalate/homocitrate/citramalate synthase